MSMQGTWCDALFVQAVVDCQNVAIHIIESRENFAGETLIEPHCLAQHPPTTILRQHLCGRYPSCAFTNKTTQTFVVEIHVVYSEIKLLRFLW